MTETNDKLAALAPHVANGHVKVMIIGLGSVGNYLMSYLMSEGNMVRELVVAGRNADKMTSDVNIARVAGLIREQCRCKITVDGSVDLDNPDTIAKCIAAHDPDIIVNSSRVFAGLKYGSISWANVRAYGIWTPLAIKYIRNIMKAYQQAESKAIVINTSYSDATIPWLKSAGWAYPDFGSGNLNHIIPRLRFAASELLGIEDYWNIEATMATAHFHDVVISKEGQDEGCPQLISILYRGAPVEVDYDALLSRCAIAMPTDQKRNMMNASSNFGIIKSILEALSHNCDKRFHSPGAFGEIGGYPIIVSGTGPSPRAFIDTSFFDLEEMRRHNRASIALDGVEDVCDGCLVYTDHLIEKAQAAFGVTLPKTVAFDEIDDVANWIISSIIKPALEKR